MTKAPNDIQPLQSPIQSEFDAFSTCWEVIQGIDLTGKVAIVTGGYSGLGLETVKVFRAAGAKVIVPARDVERARSQMGEVKDIAIEPMDLMNPDSIKKFAKKFLDSNSSLHILVNSAGIMATPFATDAHRNESQFATNHLGHFLLTKSLWPALVDAKGARVISVSSKGHRFSDIHFEDINFKNRAYEPFLAYGQSKTANILFAVELDRRGKDHGVRAFSVHPGGIPDTNLGKYVSVDALKAAGVIDDKGKAIINPAKDVKTIEQGAATQVWCATNPQLEGKGGAYCEDCNIARIRNVSEDSNLSVGRAAGGFGVLPYAINPESATRLWELSERLTM